ncbi:MAG: right-handed parallel beta-helix repeat-containing protein [Candidatus Omnitrophota bacterium]|nr:right-handed parallel beta-helix repeat-containing protein [Candidatus Omnitrophota bacterium]
MTRFDKVITLSLIISLSMVMFSSVAAAESKKEGKKIYIPEDYKTIKEALQNSEEGDKIYVKAGVYEEPSGLRLKDGRELHGDGADKTKVTLGGVGMILAGNNIIKGIGFKLKTGQIYLNAADNTTLQNCLIEGTGGIGNGLFIEKSENVNIMNCSIVNFTKGVFVRYPPVSLLLKNSIISNNRLFGVHIGFNETEGVHFSNITGKPTEPKKKGGGEIKVTLEYNDVWGSSRNYYGIEAGEHDISKDPKFVSESNYHLQPGSPCIDAGDPDSKYNDPDGSRSDMGALPYGVKNE